MNVCTLLKNLMKKYLKMLNQILEPAPKIVVHTPQLKTKLNRKYLLMFSLPKTFSLGSVREHTPYFVVHLSRALGKVFKPGNNRAGEENQKV